MFKTFLLIILSFISVFHLYAQDVPKGSIAVAKSNLEKEMMKVKEKNPKISAGKLADYGNKLLAVRGFDFSFAADAESDLGTTEVDSKEYEIYKFKKTDGSELKFATNEHGSHPCGTWTGLAVTKLSEKQLTIVADQKFYDVLMPQKLIFDEIELVGKNLKTKIRRWLTPLDAMPEAISKDGKTIYIPTEFDEIFLGISDDGSLRFVSSQNPNLIKNNTDLKNFPKEKDNDYLGYKRFGKGRQSFIVKFSYPCT